MTDADPKLLAEMRLALLGEYGAEAAYRSLGRRVTDRELRDLLGRLVEEERAQAERLAALMRALGGKPPRGSLRRRLAARALVGATRVTGPRFALRVCREAEETAARWYREYANHLARTGNLAAARECEELRAVKERHARLLGPFVAAMGDG